MSHFGFFYLRLPTITTMGISIFGPWIFGIRTFILGQRDIPDIAGIEIGILKARTRNFKYREARKKQNFYSLDSGFFNLGISISEISDFLTLRYFRDSEFSIWRFRSLGFGILIPAIQDFDPRDPGF